MKGTLKEEKKVRSVQQPFIEEKKKNDLR